MDRAEAATSVETLTSDVSSERLGLLACSVAQTLSKSDRSGVPRAISLSTKPSSSLKGANPHGSINSRNSQEVFVWVEYQNIQNGFHVLCVTFYFA